MNRNNIINFLVFQINWVIAVFGAAKGYPWLGPIFIFVWVTIHLYINKLFIWVELPIFFISGLIGYLVDSLLLLNNFIEFPTHAQLGPLSPLWMVALWVSFSTTFRHSMNWLKQKYIFAVFFAFIGGPLAYFAGQKIGAINGINEISSIIAIGISWALAFPFMLYVLNCIEKKYGNNLC